MRLTKSMDELWDESELERVTKSGATGAGSRGGKVIGKTKSGKPIYESFDHPKNQSLSAKHDVTTGTNDHEEAQKIHEKLAEKLSKKTDKESVKQAKTHEKEAEKHRNVVRAHDHYEHQQRRSFGQMAGSYDPPSDKEMKQSWANYAHAKKTGKLK